MALDDKIINFDINKPNILNLSAKQYDTTGARSFTFRLLKYSQVFNLTGLTVRVGGTKADGTLIFNDCTIVDAKRGLVQIDLTTQMQVVTGNLNLELIIMQGSIRLSTVPFQINIIEGITDTNAIESSDEFNALNNALCKINNIDKKMDKNTTDISVTQINKNLGKLDQTFMADDFLKQITGNAPINATPAYESITTDKIADKSVNYEKTTFINVNLTKNKFDKNAVTNKGYVLNAKGGLDVNAQGCISDFIPVKEGETVQTNINWNGAFYDENRKFLTSKDFGTEKFTVPAGAYFYRQSILLDTINTTMIVINDEIESGEYVPYNKSISLSDDLKDTIKDSIIIDANNTNFFVRGQENIYDSSKVTVGYVLNNTGETVKQDDGCVSDFIKIKPNTLYSFSEKWNACFYDEGQKFISLKEFGVLSQISPLNSCYIRVSIPVAKKDSYMLVEGSMPNKYIPYGGYIAFKENENLKEIAEQIKQAGDFDELYKQVDVDELAKEVCKKRYEGKKWVCIGDSLTEQNKATTKHYFDYIAEETGIEPINKGVGGTGYMRGYDNNNAFYQRVTEITDQCDVITIFGSGNDLPLVDANKLGEITDTGTDTICGCINTTLDNLYKQYPTIPIGIISPSPWRNEPNMNAGCRMDRYSQKLKEICERRSIPFLDLYRCSSLRPWDDINREKCFYNDSSLNGNGGGVHPNELGHKILSTKIREFIKTLL